MSTNSAVQVVYDAALSIQPYNSAAVTVDNTKTPAFDLGLTGWSNNYEVPQERVAVCIKVTACNQVTGDEVYKFDFLYASDSALATGKVYKTVDIAGPGVYTYEDWMPSVENVQATPEFFSIAARMSGTAPSITYQAFLTVLP